MSTTNNAPDFEALRAEREHKFTAGLKRLAEEEGFSLGEITHNHNSNACYCACTTGGPCEHTWDGKPYQSDNMWSATCARCGMLAMSHSLRTAP